MFPVPPGRFACGIEAVKLIHFYQLREKFYGNVPEKTSVAMVQVYQIRNEVRLIYI
jgi:hypothetical protein